MNISGLELLTSPQADLKFILNDQAVVFFPSSQQHREIKALGLSYEDDYSGNSLAGIVTPNGIEIRYHRAFSIERVKNIWNKLKAIPDIAVFGLANPHYQGKEL